MNKLLPIIFILLGVMFFFIGSGTFKMKDQNWTDKGMGVTSYILSALLIVYGIFSLKSKE